MLSLLSIRSAKPSWETCNTEDSNTVGTPNCLVFTFLVFKKSKKLWFGSLMSIVSSSTEMILSNSFGLIPCVCIWLGQAAKLRDACAEWRVSCAFRTGKYGKNMWIVSEVIVGIDLEVTVREQQRRVRHEKGEGEMENKDTHATNNLFTDTWAMRVCAHAWRCANVRRQTVQQKNVRATGECMYTSPSYTL